MELHTTNMEAGMSGAFFLMTPEEQQTPEQFHHGVSFFLWAWINLDNNHYQYQAGFMSEEAWGPYRQQIENLYTNCSRRWIYETFRSHRARTSFTELLETLNDPCRPEDAIPPWERSTTVTTGRQ